MGSITDHKNAALPGVGSIADREIEFWNGSLEVRGPTPTGTVATDRANLIQAIGDTPVGGKLILPANETFFNVDQALTVNKHVTIEGASGTSLLGEDPSGIMPVYPYVQGTVIRQVTAATDILKLSGTGKTVNLSNLGLIFAQGLASTGHGINADPVAAGTKVYGLYSSLWESIFVGGHDGNHYAFRVINYILNTFTQCHSYGGGGWYRGNRDEAYAGNSIWINPYVGLTSAGTAGAYDAFCETPGGLGGINGDGHIQPVVLCSGASLAASTQHLWNEFLGTAIPFRCFTVGAQLQSGGTNPLKKSRGTEFISPGQCNVLSPTNTSLGVDSLGNATGVANSTAFGYEALKAATASSQQNTAFGTQALKALTTGLQNTAVGYLALGTVTTTGGSTAIGASALAAQTTGLYNTAIGWEAGLSTTTGGNNVAIGAQALRANTTGATNLAIGTQALFASTTANGNVAIGMQAGPAITTGSQNTIIGYLAGVSVVVGAGNTLIGNTVATNGTDVNFSTAIGYLAEAVGSATALGFNTKATGAGSVAIGVDSGSVSANTAVADEIKLGTAAHTTNITGHAKIGGAGKNVSFFGAASAAKPTGVAVSAAGIHAALVTLGLIAA